MNLANWMFSVQDRSKCINFLRKSQEAPTQEEEEKKRNKKSYALKIVIGDPSYLIGYVDRCGSLGSCKPQIQCLFCLKSSTS